MFVCDECNKLFDEPVRVVFDVHTELDGNPIEYKSGCPHCQSSCIEETFTCDRCGANFPFSEVCYEGDGMYCEDCIDEIEYENELKGELLNV